MAKNKTTEIMPDEDWAAETEGQLAIDVYQTEEEVVVKAPIAGVTRSEVEISITDEVLAIKGERKMDGSPTPEGYFTQECYWGPFSRSYILPVAVDTEKAQAWLKNGLLTITMPKLEKSRTKVLKIIAEEE